MTRAGADMSLGEEVVLDDPRAPMAAQALAALVADCGAKRLPLVDYGVAFGGLGNPPPARHVRLIQRVPSPEAKNATCGSPKAEGSPVPGALEHYQRDFTVRAAAGITMGQLQAALRPTRQFLPIDAEDDMTLGEVIAHNVYGGLRLTYGGMRDLLLGLCFIDGLGRDIRAGGRTVKNVAGYDLTRFMVGNLGEFGVIYEATVRTYALPEAALIAEVQLDDPSSMDRGMSSWLTTDAASTYHYLRWEAGKWLVRIGYFGDAGSCAVQLRALEQRLEEFPQSHIVGTLRKDAQEDAAERAAHRTWRRPAPALVKVVVPPASTGIACKALRAWAEAKGVALRIEAAPAAGRILSGGDLDAAGAISFDEMLRGLVVPVGGFRAWVRRPRGAEQIAPFFPMPAELPILGRLKRAMDPLCILNPGRFLPVAVQESSR